MFLNKLIPSHILSNLYTRGSLQATEQGLTFSLKNRLMNVSITKVVAASINGRAIDLQKVSIVQGEQAPLAPASLSKEEPLLFPLVKKLQIYIADLFPPEAHCYFLIQLKAKPFGDLHLSFKDVLREEEPIQKIKMQVKVPVFQEVRRMIIQQKLLSKESLLLKAFQAAS